MKKAAFALIILLLCLTTAAQAQHISFGSRGAACPFEWQGEIWRTDMGTVMAEELYRRLRSIRQLYFIPTDEVREILANAKMDTTWNADPEKLRDVFWKDNIRIVVTGNIENIYLIRDVDGTPYADVEIRFNVINVAEASTILNDTVKYRTKAKEYITKDSPFDMDVALSILRGGANRIVTKINSGLDRYFNQNRLRRIY